MRIGNLRLLPNPFLSISYSRKSISEGDEEKLYGYQLIKEVELAGWFEDDGDAFLMLENSFDKGLIDFEHPDIGETKLRIKGSLLRNEKGVLYISIKGEII